MLKRVLVYVSNDETSECTLKYAVMLKEKTGCEIYGIYVKDIRKYEILTPTIEGFVLEGKSNSIMAEWEKVEEKNVQEIRVIFEKYFEKGKLYIEDGITPEVICDKLKGFDLLIYPKENNKIGQDLKTLLRLHFRPVIIVPKLNEFSIERVMFANDNGMNANKSIYNFIKLFDNIKYLDMMGVNIEEEYQNKESILVKEYMESYEIKVNSIMRNGDIVSEVVKEASLHDLLIMGDLKYFFMLEKITGKAGVNILEKAEKAIFIG